MNWIKDHLGPLLGGGAASGGILAILFRDGIRDVIAEWKKERDARRAERAAALGAAGQWPAGYASLIREDIAAQRVNDATLRAILDRVAAAIEKLTERQSVFNAWQIKIDERLETIERRQRSQ